jgi:nucleotide-binding universal stress UspA family protein
MTTAHGHSGGRIVVGFDGSAFAEAALEWAARQAELTGATVEAVTAWEWPTSYGWPLPVSEDYDPAIDAGKTVGKGISTAQNRHPGVTIESVVVEGYAAGVLVDRSQGADLLVVGTRGHGRFTGMLIGSVSEHCVTHARCPVLVVREDEAEPHT